MSTPLAAPLPPLAGITAALTTLRTGVLGTTRALEPFRTRVRSAASAADRIRTGATQAGTTLKGLTTPAARATAGLRQAGGTAQSAALPLRTAGDRAVTARAPLGPLTSGAASFGSVTALLGGAAGGVSRLMGLFGGAMTVAAGAMTAVNVAMRANPLGFIAGLLVPLAALLIEYALSSQTGQRIIKQVFDQVLAGFRQVGKFLGPVVQGYVAVIQAQFTLVRTAITTVLRTLSPLLTRAMSTASSAVTAPTRALTRTIRAAWSGLQRVVRPVLDWLTERIPDKFSRVRSALSGALRGMGTFLTTGMQAVLVVVTGPVNALIAFANWVVDGLNSLSFSVLGKKFGVDLPKVPQLADGGVVFPAGPTGHPSVLPLSALGRLLPAATNGAGTAAVPPARGHLAVFVEPAGASALVVADDLLFLRRTAA